MNHFIDAYNEVEDQLDVSGIENQQIYLPYHGGCKDIPNAHDMENRKESFPSYLFLSDESIVLFLWANNMKRSKAIFYITHFTISTIS